MGAVAQSISASPNAIGGYIDDAWIMTRVRVRYDNLQGANAPTRAEYLYSSLVTLALDGSAENSANEVDFEELSTYIEFAFSKQFSMFIDLPVRWVGGNNDFINQVGEQSGFGDIRAGFRYGWIACPDKALTFQFRIYSPTGDEFRGLGTGHPSFETGLLYSARTGDRKWFFAELQDWQSIDANLPTLPDESSSDSFLFNANANVLRYGLGCGYDIWQSCGCHKKQRRVTAVYEVVGWTVLHGYVTPIDYSQTTGLITADNISNASGDTIINGKYGLRYTGSNQSVYAGYGHNYTGDLWYSDLLRLEWQYAF